LSIDTWPTNVRFAVVGFEVGWVILSYRFACCVGLGLRGGR